jgi:hypothetical protein
MIVAITDVKTIGWGMVLQTPAHLHRMPNTVKVERDTYRKREVMVCSHLNGDRSIRWLHTRNDKCEYDI